MEIAKLPSRGMLLRSHQGYGSCVYYNTAYTKLIDYRIDAKDADGLPIDAKAYKIHKSL